MNLANFLCCNHNESVKSCSRATLVVLLAAVPSVQVCAQTGNQINHTLSLGTYYSTGDYGSAVDTDILYFPLTYDLQVNNWRFRLLVPHLQVEGLGNVLVNVGGVTRAFASDEVTKTSGLGDIIVTTTYQFTPPTDNGPFIDLSVDIKVPSADDDRSLGTGEYDYGVQVDIAQVVNELTLFGTLGYRLRGKSELFTGLEDSAFVQLGVARRLSETWTAGAFYDFRQAVSRYSGETHELGPYLSWLPDSKWSVTGFAGWGFTDDSPDIAVSVQLSYRW